MNKIVSVFNGTRRDFLKGTVAIAASALAAPAIAQSRPLRIGFVSPSTGPLAGAAAGDPFVLENLRSALAGGITVDGGSKRAVEIVVRDCQSNANRSSEVAADLILREGVDIMCASIHSLTVTPVADQCELNGVPLVSSITPWETQVSGRGATPDKPFRYQLHMFWGFSEVSATYMDIWRQLKTNKVVGALWPNNTDGQGFAKGFPPLLQEQAYTLVDPGRYQDLTDDYSSIIQLFKKSGVEIISGNVLAPDWTTFWTQAAQQGFKAKAATTAAALAFASTAEQLGPLAQNHSFDLFWHPTFPYKSSITGQTAADYAAAFESSTGRQWNQIIGTVHATLETAIDTLKRSGGGDREANREALFKTNLPTIQGPIVAGSGPAPNVVITPLTGAQWRMTKGGKHPFEPIIVSNVSARDVPVAGPAEATS
ncbi:conserved exported hypothetical protein [Mesorhizobium plurifarium]|uniref:Leucine-binding protein domain-containing protein n=1 Tax=Mesorhizobium plurifarium TaxID=69974 RepID=A0A090EV34_MESPL|nr:conserved exported hypothetical protein [Mesorhizobium sp. SOD10]CDX35326.1 conserved exported hypothetical protein [Mesorhizobium plurifarium]